MTTKGFLWVSFAVTLMISIILNRFAAAAGTPGSSTLQGVDPNTLKQIGIIIPIVNFNVAYIVALIGASTRKSYGKFFFGVILCLGAFIYNTVYSAKLFLGEKEDVQKLDLIVPGCLTISAVFLLLGVILLFRKMIHTRSRPLVPAAPSEIIPLLASTV